MIYTWMHLFSKSSLTLFYLIRPEFLNQGGRYEHGQSPGKIPQGVNVQIAARHH